MKHSEFVSFVKETMKDSKRTQDKRLRSFTNSITKNIMALYSGRTPKMSFELLEDGDLNVATSTNTSEIYEIEAGAFPLSFDPDSIDETEFEDGELDPFVSIVLEIDRDSKVFNVSASDKSMTGISDLGIHIAIETPSSFPLSSMKELRDEIANSVRHELEHVSQGEVSDQPAKAYARGERYYTFLHSPEDVSSNFAKYLLKPSEVPAHVRGYTQNVKSAIELSEQVESLMACYKSRDLIKGEENKIIKKTWLNWAEIHINRKGF